MPRLLDPKDAKEAAELEPIIAKMQPEQARNLSIVLNSLASVSDMIRNLCGEIEDSEALEDSDIVRYTEGMEEADAQILRAWLKQKADAIQEVYESLPLNQSRLFESLSTTAIDVYYDAENAKEESKQDA